METYMQATTWRQKSTLERRSPEARSGFSVGRCTDHALPWAPRQRASTTDHCIRRQTRSTDHSCFTTSAQHSSGFVAFRCMRIVHKKKTHGTTSTSIRNYCNLVRLAEVRVIRTNFFLSGALRRALGSLILLLRSRWASGELYPVCRRVSRFREASGGIQTETFALFKLIWEVAKGNVCSVGMEFR